MSEDTTNTATASVEATSTISPGVVVGEKAGAAKPQPKVNKTSSVAAPVGESVKITEVVAEPPCITIDIDPIKEITKDTHMRLTQYLGIVNPGVLRIMAEMLREQEQKVLQYLSKNGVKS